jgi:hypothetical protein
MRSLSTVIAAVMALTLIGAVFADGDEPTGDSEVEVSITVLEWAQVTAGKENISVVIRNPGAWFGDLDALTVTNNVPVDLTIAEVVASSNPIEGTTLHVVADPSDTLASPAYDWTNGVFDGEDGFTPSGYQQWGGTWQGNSRTLLLNRTAYRTSWGSTNLYEHSGVNDGKYVCEAGNRDIPVLYAARGGSWGHQNYGTDYMPQPPASGEPFLMTLVFQVRVSN